MYGIEEALAAADVTALVQKRISPVVNEAQRRYAPFVASVPTTPWNSTVFNWDTRAKLPTAGAVTDGGTRPVGVSTYIQSTVKIRNLLGLGGVTGYAEAVTSSFGSLRGREIIGMIKSLTWAVESFMAAGNAAATAFGPYPQFDGLDTLCSQTTGTGQNVYNFTGATFTLAAFDVVIDMVEENLADSVYGDDWMFVTSPSLDSKVAQLLTNQQRFNTVPKAEVAAGLIVPTYRNIPIVKSSFLSAKGGAMTTIAAASTSTGGHIGTGKRYYKLTAVIGSYGESAPSNEANITIGSGSTNIVTLSFTPPTTPDGGPVLLYKVWESATTGTETLLGIVDGCVGSTNNGMTPIVTTSIVDTGVALVPHNGSTVPAQGPSTYVGGNAGMKPAAAGSQDFYLVSRDPANIVRPYVRDSQPLPNLAPTIQAPDQLPFAIVTDTALGLRMPKFIGRGGRVTVNLASA